MSEKTPTAEERIAAALALYDEATHDSPGPSGWLSTKMAAALRGASPFAAEERVRGLLADVAFPGYRFRVGHIAGAFLQVVYDEPDVESGALAEQRGRKWYVSSHATPGEVAQTALKAILTSHEHRVREHFAWRGARVFGPHFDLEQLAELARGGATEKRPAPGLVTEATGGGEYGTASFHEAAAAPPRIAVIDRTRHDWQLFGDPGDDEALRCADCGALSKETALEGPCAGRPAAQEETDRG